MAHRNNRVTRSAKPQREEHPEDIPLPFELFIGSAQGAHGKLAFTETLRLLPGKRLVGSGLWSSEPVLIKLFYGKAPRKYWLREDRGSRILQSSPAAAPKILHSGNVADRDWHIVILEWIREAQTLDNAWKEASDDTERESLVRLLVDHVASHHRAGILQKDMHLSNFLESKGTIYSIDGAQVKAVKRLTKSQALRNLAQLLALLPLRMQGLIPDLFEHYRRHLGEPVENATGQEFLRVTAGVRRRLARRHLKKMFRNCTAIKVDRLGTLHRLYLRNKEGPDLGKLLIPDLIDQPSNEARVLKRGNSSTVWASEMGGRGCTFKRYNVKSTLHGIKLALRESRALKSWRNAHRLGFHGINTLHPVAAILEKPHLFTRRAWFISDFIIAEDAARFFSFNRQMTASETLVARKICSLIVLMGRNRISHGDLKATNILIKDGEPFLIDLDALQEHATPWMARRKVQKDQRRFLANWQEYPVLLKQFGELLQQLNKPGS